jgi:hypothetical protein
MLILVDLSVSALARRLGVKALPTDRAWQRIAAAAQVEIQIIR